jgi:hypothetical protein
MKIKNDKFLPIEIYINRNHTFFANIEWLLYKKFRKTRTIPCGRFKKDKYLCCCQPNIDEEHCYYNKDHTKVYCKCCNSLRMMGNHPIDLKHYFDEPW